MVAHTWLTKYFGWTWCIRDGLPHVGNETIFIVEHAIAMTSKMRLRRARFFLDDWAILVRSFVCVCCYSSSSSSWCVCVEAQCSLYFVFFHSCFLRCRLFPIYIGECDKTWNDYDRCWLIGRLRDHTCARALTRTNIYTYTIESSSRLVGRSFRWVVGGTGALFDDVWNHSTLF